MHVYYCLGFFYFKPKTEIAQCSKETAAKIIQINHRIDDNNDDQYQLVYQYYDDNYTYTYNSKYSGYYRDYEVGQTITVFTDPKDPAHVIFDYTPDAFILYICAIILGGTMFICLFVDIVSLIKFIQYSLR